MIVVEVASFFGRQGGVSTDASPDGNYILKSSSRIVTPKDVHFCTIRREMAARVKNCLFG